MTTEAGLALLEAARRGGVSVLWSRRRPCYHGPAAALALAKEAPDTAKEVLRRAVAFREQIDRWAKGGRVGVPVLALPDATEPRIGQCISCGDAAPGWRCGVCLAAIELALGLLPVPDGSPR